MGGVAWNTNTKSGVSIHLYGGTYTVTADNTKGSPIAIQNNGGELHIHEGVKVIGSATAPAIYVGTSSLRTSELYMSGVAVEGKILINDCATDKGFSTTVELDNCTADAVELGKDVSFLLAGDTVIDKLTVATGAKFTVGELTSAAMIIVAGNGVVSEVNTNMSGYLKYFKAYSGEVSVENHVLVVTE